MSFHTSMPCELGNVLLKGRCREEATKVLAQTPAVNACLQLHMARHFKTQPTSPIAAPRSYRVAPFTTIYVYYRPQLKMRFRNAGWEVVEVVWVPTHNPTHVVHLMSWDCPYPIQYFDVMWCYPDCTQYARARSHAKTPRDLARADALVERCLQLIPQLEPCAWMVENPFSGLPRTRGIMQGIPCVVLDYCMCQDPSLYCRRTAIWSNCTDWNSKLCDCTHLENGRRHTATAQR